MSSPKSTDRPASALTAEHRRAAARQLRDLAERRKRWRWDRPLTISIDGRESCTWDVVRQQHLHLTASGEVERLEVHGVDDSGVLLLASHVFTDAARHEDVASLVLEGGQRIVCRVKPAAGTLEIDLDYRELQPLRALALWGSRLLDRLRYRRQPPPK